MKQHPYEYKVLVEYINPEEKGEHAHFTHKDDQQAFTNFIEKVFEYLPDAISEGWEVNSHNITISKDTLIVTVLLRRLIVK